MATELITIELTKEEILKIKGLISVVLEPLRKASEKAVIPKQRREAKETLAEVQVILNKLNYDEGEKENA